MGADRIVTWGEEEGEKEVRKLDMVGSNSKFVSTSYVCGLQHF